MLLALDTATRQAGVALYDGTAGLIAESQWHSGNRHTEELMPAVAQMLARASVSVRDLQAVAVALGPGSFTGLRVGLAVAKGLVLAHRLAVIGVPTLDIVAYPHQAQPALVVAVVQAGRGRIYWAPYGHGPDGWGAQAPPALASVAELAGTLARATIFAGEITPADRQLLVQGAGRGRVHFLAPALAARRAGYLAELAWQRHEAGQTDDPVTLSPLYLQAPEGTLVPAFSAATPHHDGATASDTLHAGQAGRTSASIRRRGTRAEP